MTLRIHGQRPLKTLPGRATRPTTARVREAVFNIWQGHIAGCRWLDLCAGSGAMGAEALSRGAAGAIALEQSSQACHIIRANWQQVASPEQTWQVLRGDVRQRLPELAGQPFDRIYFDPPYASDLYDAVLAAIATHELLAPEGELAVEYGEASWQPSELPPLRLRAQKRYGRTHLAFYGRAEADL